MTDSSTTSRDFAPSWLRSSNHSPTPPFRALSSSGAASRDDWERSGCDRKLPGSGRSQWGSAANGDHQSENYFQYNGRISDYLDSHHGDFFRRSNSIGVNPHGKHNTLLNRNHNNANGYHHPHDMWNDRPKHDHNHHRNGNSPFAKGYASRDSHANSNGISYSFVTTKGLKPGSGRSSVTGPTSPPALQPSDFPSLSSIKSEPTKSAQNTVWGNPPHLAKVMKRSLSSQNYLEGGGGTILGPHYGKGFFQGDFRRDLKDELDALNSGSGDGIGVDEYAKSEFTNGSTESEDFGSQHEHQETLTDAQHDMESNSMQHVDWTISEVPRREHQTVEPSMLSSTGSTGSVESIDSHHSNLSGGAMMVDDLLEEMISEEEKSRVFHALEEIKERTGSVSYYERVALRPDSDVSPQNRLKGFPDVKVEDVDEEDPDDRLLK
ncbi:hypothetical protein RvY_12343 [Ramazzottius varieornatus]|uniref:Uncharacterized protein n=1 Tax=Ramazzottius varieornatus TaxID=947166 RepID=A0A1D1VJ58_RAMVA|nr:hypothetical protein RvY_12343 [Ramazzottius varieornatus]